jgi:hypothetical protein
VLNQLAAAALWLDKGQVLCARGSLVHVVQPHSFWHVLSAASLLFLYRYEREVDRAHRHTDDGVPTAPPSQGSPRAAAAER